MTAKKKESGDDLHSAIRALIIQEVRLLGLDRERSPSFMVDEMNRSIQETKRRVMALIGLMEPGKREALIRKVIRQSMDEEIEWVTQARRNKCLRCIHVRYFDASGAGHANLPLGENLAEGIGCDLAHETRGTPCQRFAEQAGAISLSDYLKELTVLYQFEEMLDEMVRLWEDYLTR